MTAALAALLAAAAVVATLPPPEHRCPTRAGAPPEADGGDAALVREGETLGWADLPRLRELLPAEVWRKRSVFFHEGMRMQIGACHRRYPVAEAQRAATARFAGRARLDAEGNLHDHVAGLPFPPASIDPDADDAALRWAWNLERRYRGAGPRGSFRIDDFPGRVGDVETYTGSWFHAILAHRADLGASAHRVPLAEESVWAAGGRFDAPTAARHLAWLQRRPLASARRHALPDDVFVYAPELRRVRRAPGAWSDGLFLPRYGAAAGSGGGPIAIGGRGAGVAVRPGSGAAGVADDLGRGFTALSLRPNAYAWRMLGVREVLAPLNVARGGYPQRPRRRYGPSGLSLGSDRWDVRQAVVIEGALRVAGRDHDHLTLYVDSETQQPLFVMTHAREGHRLLGVGILAHRYSGDVPGYPAFPDGEDARVFDPVAAVFVDVAGGGWRRESHDLDSTPPGTHELQRMLSASHLERGR